MSNWPKGLKPGDEVIVSGNVDSIAVVDDITPSGLIKVNGRLFYEDGTQRGSKESRYNYRIREATPDIVAIIREKDLCGRAYQSAP